ncbi:hypothetical protein BH09VER1_BH09VER1_18260 [soil metagenome]
MIELLDGIYKTLFFVAIVLPVWWFAFTLLVVGDGWNERNSPPPPDLDPELRAQIEASRPKLPSLETVLKHPVLFLKGATPMALVLVLIWPMFVVSWLFSKFRKAS